MITVNRKVIIEACIFLLVIYAKISKIFPHFVEVLFHLLFIIISRNVLRRLIYVLSCLPSKIWTFWWKLTKLLSKVLSLVFSGVKSCIICFRGLWRFKEILLWSRWLNVHFTRKILWHISKLIIVRTLLLRYKIVGSGRRVISPVTLCKERFYSSFWLMKGFLGFWGGSYICWADWKLSYEALFWNDGPWNAYVNLFFEKHEYLLSNSCTFFRNSFLFFDPLTICKKVSRYCCLSWLVK